MGTLFVAGCSSDRSQSKIVPGDITLEINKIIVGARQWIPKKIWVSKKRLIRFVDNLKVFNFWTYMDPVAANCSNNLPSSRTNIFALFESSRIESASAIHFTLFVVPNNSTIFCWMLEIFVLIALVWNLFRYVYVYAYDIADHLWFGAICSLSWSCNKHKVCGGF